MAARVVDYSPLQSTPTPQEVREYKQRMIASGAPWSTTPVIQIVIVAVVALVAAAVVLPAIGGIVVAVAEGMASGSSVSGILLFVVLAGVGLVGFAIVRVVLAGSSRWGRWLRLDRFAQANGLIFSPSSAAPSYPGAIFQIGDSRRSTEHFRTAEGRFLDFGNYQYTTGSGKNRTTRQWGFLAIELDRRLPHMVLDSRANNGLFGGTNLPVTFTRDQVLSLEGDFDRYFTLYCPKEYERDALYVFTPDLMALLIDEAAPYDVEIVDDWMFVYSAQRFPVGQPAVYDRLFRIVETVGAKTLTQTDRYRDDRAAAPFAANVVAPQGTRLRKGVSAGAIVLIVAAALIWGWSFVGDVIAGFSGG